MRFERFKNSARNILWGLVNRVVVLFFPFIIRTIMINTLGVEYLGLNSLFVSILNVLSLIELGFGSALVHSMYKPIAEKNEDKICALLSLYRKFYFLMGCIIGMLGSTLIPFIEHFINGSPPNDINMTILYCIYLFDTVLSYLMFAYKTSLLLAHQRSDINSNIGSVVSLTLYVVQMALLLLFKNYYYYVIVKPIFTLINNLVIAYVTNRLYPNYLCRGKIDKKITVELYSKIKALIGHKIGVTVITSADNLVISAFLGLTLLAIYNNYYQIVYAVIGVMGIGYNSILAGVGNSLVTESREKNYELFNNINFVVMWIVEWISICLLCLFQPFMEIWMGRDMVLPFDTVVLLVVYFFTWQFRVTILSFKDAAGMWNSDFWKPYIGALANIILNILLVQSIGINGVLISTIVCMIVIYFPWETNVLFNELFVKSPCIFYKQQLLFSMKTVVMCIIVYLLCNLISAKNINGLLMKILICCIIPNIFNYVMLHRMEEFKFIKMKLYKIKS